MKVVTWNMNKRKKGNWEFLLSQINPDVVLAQEASPLPDGVLASTHRIKKNHRLAIYTRNNDHQIIKMHSDLGMGLFVAKLGPTYFVNVYANLDFKPVEIPLLGLIASYVSVLRRQFAAESIVIAGDFNMDRRMDDNPTGSKFNTKSGTYPHNGFFDAILELGFQECMRKFHPGPVQTYRHNVGIFPWELDHMFVTTDLYSRLQSSGVIEATSHSDHDPIACEFKGN